MENKMKNNTPQMNSGAGKKNKQNNKNSLFFMIGMLVIYIVLYALGDDKINDAIVYVYEILKDLLPILVLVYVFMAAMSFMNEKKLRKTIEKAPSWFKYVMMSVLGTLSHGPIYAWYPFLKDLNEKGISKGNAASFLYARGIKLTLLPMLISFFDFKFAMILSVVTFIFALIQGIMIDLTVKNS
ncbi:MAG: permease [Clostridia bacterium]|nr:permease [Clostridia bacterium]